MVLCLLDDASVTEVLDGLGLGGKDLVNLTTGTPEQARDLDRTAFAALLTDWLRAMAGSAQEMAAQLESGDYTEGVVSNLAMMAAGNDTLLATATGQSVDPRLLTPYMDLMRRRVAQGHGAEDLAGTVGLLRGV
ncbi:hypothetical protein [Streptomyces sp. NPDC048462]|uniref:imine reductase family protein n=1 Tax=Streptomyces sp. NPDC048462 TaxID=3365555 RepID=UPI003724A112